MLVTSQTTTALLEGLLDPDAEPLWREFDARYRPIILAFARKLGLNEADAADAAQETLARFLVDYRAGKYDRGRGRLRSWLVGIARHRIADLHRIRAARREWRGDSALADLANRDDFAAIWDAECRRAILDRAMNELRRHTRMDGRTVRVFEMIAREQRAPAEVAAEIGMSVKEVYVAKHRALSRFREIITELNTVYEIER